MKGNDSSLPGSLDWLLGYEDGTEIFLREQAVGSCWVRTLEGNVTTQSSKAEIVKWFVPCHWASALMPLSGLFWHMTHWRNQSGEHTCIFTKAHTILLIERHTWEKKICWGDSVQFLLIENLDQMLSTPVSGVILDLRCSSRLHGQKTATPIYTGVLYESLRMQIPSPLLPPSWWCASFFSCRKWLSATRVCKLPPAPPHSLSFYHSGISPWLQMQLSGCFVPRESSAPNVALGRKNSWSLMARLITLGIKKSWGEGGNRPLLPADLPRQR